MMATASSVSSLSDNQQEASSLDELPIQDSVLFSDSLKDLRNLGSQLCSAAEYFELSYINDGNEELVSRTLKDYVVQALANSAKHLGSVSYQVRNFLNQEFDEISVAELEVSCIEQRLQTCQASFDQEGLKQQSLLMKPPEYHKHYVLQVGESMTDPGFQPAIEYQGFNPPKENIKLKQLHTATRNRLPLARTRNDLSQTPPSSSWRRHSLPPSCMTRSTTPLLDFEKIYYKARRERLPHRVRAPNPLARTRSEANKPPISNSSNKHHMESQNPVPISLHAAEKNNHKDSERNRTKKKGFLKSLLKRSTWSEELFYSYLNEY